METKALPAEAIQKKERPDFIIGRLYEFDFQSQMNTCSETRTWTGQVLAIPEAAVGFITDTGLSGGVNSE
ncbi:MAG: hypothetical protein LBK99_18940 [Opitutaceae bacterium]|nr:hypothetical protein [Opitutaceae bacterium]